MKSGRTIHINRIQNGNINEDALGLRKNFRNSENPAKDYGGEEVSDLDDSLLEYGEQSVVEDEPSYMNMSHQDEASVASSQGSTVLLMGPNKDVNSSQIDSVNSSQIPSDPVKLVDGLMFRSQSDRTIDGSSSVLQKKSVFQRSPVNLKVRPSTTKNKSQVDLISPQGISDFPFILENSKNRFAAPPTPNPQANSEDSQAEDSDNKNNNNRRETGRNQKHETNLHLLNSPGSRRSDFWSVDASKSNPVEDAKEDVQDSFKNAERLNVLGGKLLSLGRYEQAIEVFSHAALCAKSDLMRVKRLIQRSSRKKFATLGSVIGSHHSVTSSNSSIPSAALTQNEETDHNHKLMLRIASTIADIFNNTGVAYEMVENYDKAIASCKDALKIYKNTCDRHENMGDKDVDRTAHNVAQMQLGRNTLAKRRELHSYALSLAKEAMKQDITEVRRRYIDDALHTLRTVLILEKESLGETHPSVARTLMEVAKLHVEKESFDAAFQEMSQAVRMLRHSLGSNHPDVGRALATLAALFDERNVSTKVGDGSENVVLNDRENAITLYREALRALRASLGEEHPEVGATFNNIGALFYADKDYEKALIAFTAARKAYGGGKVGEKESPIAVMNTSKYLAEIVLIWHNIGEVHLQKDECRKALTAYNSALNLLRNTTVRNNATNLESEKNGLQSESHDFSSSFSLLPRKMSVDFDLLTATTLQSMATIQTSLGSYAHAISMYENALQILENQGKEDQDVEKTIQTSVEMASIIESIGGVYEQKEDLEKAMKYYLRALNRHKIYHAYDGPDVALLLGKIGSIHFYMVEYEEAVATFAESIELFKYHGVSNEHPVVQQIEARLAEADMRLHNQDDDSVATGISSAISEIYGVDDNYTQSSHRLNPRSLEKEASMFNKEGDYESAIHSYKQALSIRRERCAELSPTLPFERRRKEHSSLCRTLVKISEIHIKRKELEVAKPLLFEAVRTCKTFGVSSKSKLVKYAMYLLDGIRKKSEKQKSEKHLNSL